MINPFWVIGMSPGEVRLDGVIVITDSGHFHFKLILLGHFKCIWRYTGTTIFPISDPIEHATIESIDKACIIILFT